MSSPNHTLLRSFPWHQTPLGPSQGWPPEMHSVLQVIMACGVPVCTHWGEDLIQIYNDGYAQLLEDNHPACFGASLSVSASGIWPFSGETPGRVWRTGEPLVMRDTLLAPAKAGGGGARYIDLSFSAIKARHGDILGVLSIASETTAAVTSRHQQRASQDGADEQTRRTRAVAHDLNNVLTVVLGNLDVLEERLRGDAELKLVASALRAAEEATALTNRLLTEFPVAQPDDRL